jgi:hypothetical protein
MQVLCKGTLVKTAVVIPLYSYELQQEMYTVRTHVTHVHTCIRTRDASICAYVQMMHPYVHTYKRCIHTCDDASIHAYVQAMHPCVHTYKRCMHA